MLSGLTLPARVWNQFCARHRSQSRRDHDGASLLTAGLANDTKRHHSRVPKIHPIPSHLPIQSQAAQDDCRSPLQGTKDQRSKQLPARRKCGRAPRDSSDSISTEAQPLLIRHPSVCLILCFTIEMWNTGAECGGACL